MDDYEKAVVLWKERHIVTGAELAEAMNGQEISFAYHSGKIENERITYNDTREIFEHDGVTDYVTGKNEIGASPEDVQEEMAELLSEFEDISNEKALIAAAYFHVKFENIHPYADGNGRTGRLLMNYLLLLHGHPPIIVHEEDRKLYYSALEAWDEQQDLEPMISFLREQTGKTWKKQIERKERSNRPIR